MRLPPTRRRLPLPGRHGDSAGGGPAGAPAATGKAASVWLRSNWQARRDRPGPAAVHFQAASAAASLSPGSDSLDSEFEDKLTRDSDSERVGS
jgi:hypothetical protein